MCSLFSLTNSLSLSLFFFTHKHTLTHSFCGAQLPTKLNGWSMTRAPLHVRSTLSTRSPNHPKKPLQGYPHYVCGIAAATWTTVFTTQKLPPSQKSPPPQPPLLRLFSFVRVYDFGFCVDGEKYKKKIKVRFCAHTTFDMCIGRQVWIWWNERGWSSRWHTGWSQHHLPCNIHTHRYKHTNRTKASRHIIAIGENVASYQSDRSSTMYNIWTYWSRIYIYLYIYSA